MIEPLEVAELTTDAIEAKVVGEEGRVMEVLQQILVDGTRFDALAFLVACVYTISCGVRPGEPVALWPVQVNQFGAVRPIPGNDQPGIRLFAEILGDYLAGSVGNIRVRWTIAADDVAAGAVGAAISAAAAMVKQRRAELQ